MRTFEEIKVHLTKTAYTKEAITKIMGFLIGAGLKEADEQITVVYGASTFEDFLAWIDENDDCDCCDECDCVLCGIINDITDKLVNAEAEEEQIRYTEQLIFLLESFDLVDVDELFKD